VTSIDPIDASSVATLHAAFRVARADFEDAVRAAAGRWEDKILEPEVGGGEPWPPHMAAAHALLGERWRFRHIEEILAQPPDAATVSAEAFASTPAGQQELEQRRARYAALDGAEATIAAAATEWPEIDATYARLEDRDLTRPAGLFEGQLGYLESQGQPPSDDIRGCLILAVVHLTDHAQQLRQAVS